MHQYTLYYHIKYLWHLSNTDIGKRYKQSELTEATI